MNHDDKNPLLLFQDFLLAQMPMQRRVVRQLYDSEFEDLTQAQRNEILYKTTLSAITEWTEFLNAGTNWKMNKRVHPIDREKALEEYIDVLKFTLNVPLYMGFTVDEIRTMFRKKTAVVLTRFAEEFQQGERESQSGGGEHV